MEGAVYHIPAMLKETIEGLAIKPDGVYVDVTFGGGGHSRAILREMDNAQCTMDKGLVEGSVQKAGHLYSFDQDIDAFANAKQLKDDSLELKEVGKLKVESCEFFNNPHWEFVHSNFRYLKNWMDYYGVTEIDGLLADLGLVFIISIVRREDSVFGLVRHSTCG